MWLTAAGMKDTITIAAPQPTGVSQRAKVLL